MSVFESADPATVDEQLNVKLDELDRLTKELDLAITEYDNADKAWLELYDAVAETLREEYRDAGRKSDPAEHVLVTETRREHRAAYTRWKRAKRDLDGIKLKIDATSKVLSGRQSQAKGLREEMRAGVYAR